MLLKKSSWGVTQSHDACVSHCTCTVWSWLLMILMTRPEFGLLPPPGGGTSPASAIDDFLLSGGFQPCAGTAAPYHTPFFLPELACWTQTRSGSLLYVTVTVHCLTTHKLHTNKMHFLFFNPYTCFNLYKAIFRGLVMYIYFTSIIYVCYYAIYHM